MLLSTNFFALTECNVYEVHGRDKSIKFIAAFLLSSFGQLQFEIHGNSQEGSRKIEKRNIEKIQAPNPNSLSPTQIDNVLKAYHSLDDLDVDFLGNEDINLRNDLDNAVSQVIFMENNLGFNNANELMKHFQKFLKELVENRILT
jgi:hypothetical protein